jgi:hypothetical protein
MKFIIRYSPTKIKTNVTQSLQNSKNVEKVQAETSNHHNQYNK